MKVTVNDRYLRKITKRSKLLTWILLILIFLLAAALAVSLFVIDKLNKNNMFSKSILLENNYFLGQSVKYPAEEGENPERRSDEDIIESILREVFGEETYSASVVSEEYRENSGGEEEIMETDGSSDYYAAFAVDIIREELLRIVSTYGGFGEPAINDITALLIDYTGNENIRETVLKCIGIETDGEKQIPIRYISQEGILPNGCESVSAAMLLCHAGYETDPLEFVEKFLDCEPVSIVFGCRYGPNPKYFYAGDPKSEKNGWGCFAPVIVKAINRAIPASEKRRAVNLTGLSLPELCRCYIDNDIPAAIWATVGMREVKSIIQWQSPDRSQSFLYPSNEHCLVLIGYDKENYIFADPFDSLGIVSYPKADVETAYAMLGRQAVAIAPAG